MKQTKLIPELRFKGFEGEWEEKKLKEVLIYEQPTKYIVKNTDYSNSYNIPVLTAGKSFILGYTNEKEGIYQASAVNPVIIFDDFTTSNHFVTFPFKVKSSAMKILKPTTKKIIMKFVYEAFSKIKVKLGEDHKRYWISEYSNIRILVPKDDDEQTKIANFLSTVDTKIEQTSKQIELLEKYKKGMMQELFPQKGQTNPKLRFKDDEGKSFGDWKKKRLGQVFAHRSERGNARYELLSVTMNKGVIQRTDIEGKDNSSKDKSNYKIVKIGDIAYNSMRMWQGASGVSNFEGIVSPAYTVITPLIENIPMFWGYYFKTPRTIHLFKSNSQGLTSDTWNLKYPQLSAIKFYVPIKEEQQKIASFLYSLDQKIEKTQEQLVQLQEWKKGLLQKMMV